MVRKFLLILVCALMSAQCSGRGDSASGLQNGDLRPCPDSPNCVSSRSPNPDQFVLPISYSGPSGPVRNRLLAVLESMKRVRIVTATDRYIHAEFTSAVFRFVDDVECLLDEADSLIHIRSASRVGYSDLGVNRRRVERIRALFQASATDSLAPTNQP